MCGQSKSRIPRLHLTPMSMLVTTTLESLPTHITTMTRCTSSNILVLLLMFHAVFAVSRQTYPPTVINTAAGPPLSAVVLSERQAAVREAFLHAWNGYREYAWGADEL